MELLKAVQSTILKLDPTKQSSELLATQKYALPAGKTLSLKAAAVAANNYLQLTLATPLAGYTTWYAYAPHVQVLRDEGAKLESARDRQRVFNDYLAVQRQDGSDMNQLSFLDRGVERSAYANQLHQYPDRLHQLPDGKTVFSLGAALQLTESMQTVTFSPYPNRGTIPTIDTAGLNFLHPELTEACICVGSYVDGQMRSHWLGRKPLSNVQAWSATKIVPILNVLCQSNVQSTTTPIRACTIVDSQDTVNSISFVDAAIDVVSYRKDNIETEQMISNRTADMFKRFNSLPGLEAWFRTMTGNSMQFRGYYEGKPLIRAPQLRANAALLLAAPPEGESGANLVSAYDLTRIMTMLGWHVVLLPTAKLPGAQWHSLATMVECLGYDCARYVDVAIDTLGLAAHLRDVVILSKMGFGQSASRDCTELTYTALVQFVDTRSQTANRPATLRTLAMTLRAALRRVAASGRRDLDEEARQIDSRMAAEVTELLRRLVTQELA
jgi:hypothetical protein